MYKTGLHENQSRLLGYPKLVDVLPKDHPLVLLRDQIPFEQLVDIITPAYSSAMGAPSKSIRKLIALELLKARYGYADRDLVQVANTDMAVMYFCGYEYPSVDSIHSSTMTKFRNRLTNDMIQMIQDVALGKQIQKLHRTKKGSLQVDTTCVPENIVYPTDTGLLATCIKKVTRIIETIRKEIGGEGQAIIMRGRRLLEKSMRQFSMQRKKTKQQIVKMQKKLLKKAMIYYKQASSIIATRYKKSQHLFGAIRSQRDSTMQTVHTILTQQGEMMRRKMKSVQNRIVSIHKPYVRPIFRGKAKDRTEFGGKVTVTVIGGTYMQINSVDDENVSDTQMVHKAVHDYERMCGKPPNEISTDRGGHSPKNHAYLHEKNIADGIQYRGKIPKNAQLPSSTTRKRMARGRAYVEGLIGIAKRKYGMQKNTYSHQNRLGGMVFKTMMMNYCIHL